jgi:hypothetical protein
MLATVIGVRRGQIGSTTGRRLAASALPGQLAWSHAIITEQIETEGSGGRSLVAPDLPSAERLFPGQGRGVA